MLSQPIQLEEKAQIPEKAFWKGAKETEGKYTAASALIGNQS